jgi:hypothetical protein
VVQDTVENAVPGGTLLRELLINRDLARIIHELSAATPDTLADTALRSVGRLDVSSYTPATASVARLVSAASPSFRDDNS